jgi:F-type H+-transporting ATPase subunit epsilon
MTVHVLVIAPGKEIWNKEVDEVILPGKTGEIGVLKGHTNLITVLAIGIVRMRVEENWIPVVVLGGFATITNTSVIVLASEAETIIPGNYEDSKRSLSQLSLEYEQLKAKDIEDIEDIEDIKDIEDIEEEKNKKAEEKKRKAETLFKAGQMVKYTATIIEAYKFFS